MEEEIEEKFFKEWKHCMRCNLSAWRLRISRSANKTPARVPYGRRLDRVFDPEDSLPEDVLMYILLPFPDLRQVRNGNVSGVSNIMLRHGDEEDIYASLSKNMASIIGAIDILEDHVFLSKDQIGVGFGVPCRPSNYEDSTRTVAIPPSSLNSCRPRLDFEVSHANPDLIYIAGKDALSSLDTRLKSKYIRLRGEVIDVEIEYGNGQTKIIPGYVGCDPFEALEDARDSQITIEGFRYAPLEAPSSQPFHNWLWHFMYASQIAWTTAYYRGADLSPLRQRTWLWSDTIDSVTHYFNDKGGDMSDLVDKASELSQREKKAPTVEDFLKGKVSEEEKEKIKEKNK